MSSNEVFEKGRQCFDAGDYFEAHEVWEDLWMEEQGARRHFLQGLIQTSVCLYHAGNGNLNGAEKMAARALGYLEKGMEDSDPIDIPALINELLGFVTVVGEHKAGNCENKLPFFKLPLK